MSKTIQMKTTIVEGGVKQQVNGYPITTPDRVIDGEGVSVEDALSEKQNITDNNLQTSNKQIVSAINEVNSLAKQANKAKSFVNYQSLIEYLNSAGSSEFNAGQIFNIQTTNVPDLWVYSVEQGSVPYTYTTDDAFVTATSQIGGQQVGYYKLAQLEIKIDMEDYSQIVLIQSTSSTTHSGQTVPELTVQQVIDAYNGLVAGNTVVIESATTYQNFSVIQAHGIGDLIAIYIIYNKDLILCYQVSGSSVVITSQNIGGVKMQVKTQAEFDALTTYEENTEYAII